MIFAHAAKVDQALRKKRMYEGIQRARKENKYHGRKSVITPSLLKDIKRYQSRDLSNLEIMKLVSISQSTFYKAMKIMKNSLEHSIYE